MNFKYSHCLVLFYNRRYNPLIIQEVKKKLSQNITCLVINLGENQDYNKIQDESLRAGADKFILVDGKNVFANEYLTKEIKANGIYQHKYLLSAALARPALAKISSSVAIELKADCIIHGFRGNDQIRMDMMYDLLEIKSLAALREFAISSEMVEQYSQINNIPEEIGTNNPYSISSNIWGKSTECGILDDPSIHPPEEIFQYVKRNRKEIEQPILITLSFNKGIPVKLNQEKLILNVLIERLNLLAANAGVGIVDMIEDGTVGVKTRAIYENPAALCILQAHKELETFINTKHLNLFKPYLEHKWSEMVYNGLWFDPLMECLNNFFDSANQNINGEVTLELYKGHINICSRSSKHSFYNSELAIYNFGHLFSQDDAKGFSKVFNLHTKLYYQKLRSI